MLSTDTLASIVRRLVARSPERRAGLARRAELRCECQWLEARRLLAHGINATDVSPEWSYSPANAYNTYDFADVHAGTGAGGAVRYFDGTPVVEAADLASEAFGTPWGHARSWSPDYSGGPLNGLHWDVWPRPHLVQKGSGTTEDPYQVAVVESGTLQRWFQLDTSTGAYTALLGDKHRLTHSGTEFTLLAPDGGKTRFHDFTVATDVKRGKFVSYTSPGGTKTEVPQDGTGYAANGDVLKILRTDGTDTESFEYAYVAGGVTLSSVSLKHNGAAKRRVDYEYYGASDGNGTSGDLKMARVVDPAADKSVTSLTRGGVDNRTATATTAGHGYLYGDTVVVAGASHAEFNGTFVITGTTANTFTYRMASAPAGDASGTIVANKPLDIHYYRYYTSGESGGSPGSLQQVFGPEAWGRLTGALTSEPFAASDSAAASYSDFYFAYDAEGRVSQATVSAAGCSTCTGGQGTFKYVYADNPAADAAGVQHNTWRRKVTEILPDTTAGTDDDNDRNIIFANEVGQVMLTVFQEAAEAGYTGPKWRTYYEYDNSGRLLMSAHPSAVTGHDEAKADLVEKTSGTAPATSAYTHITTSGSGLLEINEYHASGAAAGYLFRQYARRNDSTSAVKLRELTYTSRTVGGESVPLPYDETVYRNEDGTGGQTSYHDYSFFGDDTPLDTSDDRFQVKVDRLYRPAATAAQNGSDVNVDVATTYDAYGRVVRFVDGDGFAATASYDNLSGGVTQTVADEGTGRLNLTTAYEVDFLGRATKETDANGNVTYTVHRDVEHETRTYRGWDAATNTPTGPTEVTRWDRARLYVETLTLSAAPAVSGGRPTGTEVFDGSVKNWSRSYYNGSGQVTKADVYTSLPYGGYSYTADVGTLGTDYLRTTYGYDDRGRRNRVVDPAGTITRTVYDSRDRVASTWTGTNDTGATHYDPDGSGSPNNMVEVSGYTYDFDAVGNGNLTRSTADQYYADYRYDWRDRRVQAQGWDDVTSKRTLDNLGQATATETYADADGDFVTDTGELRAKSEALFDERGQVYRTRVYEVSGGAASDRLTTDFWYDGRGNPIKSKGPNGLLSKAAYDGAGRMAASYTGYDEGAGESSYSAADDVAGDTVIEQSTTIYDKGGRPVTGTTFARLDGDTGTTGELTAANAYAQVAVSWYDKADRVTHAATYGRDNGGTRYVYDTSGNLIDGDSDGLPDEAENAAREPNTSDDYIAVKAQYDAAGRGYRGTDNMGRVTEATFDLAGRVTKVVENYVNGVAAETETDTDVTTETVYDSSGRVSKLVSKNPKGSGGGVESQETRFLYESTINKGWATSTIHPDSTDTTSAGTDQVKVSYDRLGRRTGSTDQRGVTHTYAYDGAGRLASDSVTGLPGTVPDTLDTSVRRVQYGYDSLGRVETVSSYDNAAGTGTPVNQVKHSFNGWGNVSREEQAHDGAVGAGTPHANYTFTDGASGGEAKYVRLSETAYPDASVVHRNYPTSGIGDKLSRADSVAADSAGTTKFAQYTYLGAATVTKSERPGVSGGLRITHGSGGTYGGWDRFGRVVDQNWSNDAGTTDVDRFQYAYDRNSNRTSRAVATTGVPAGQDEAYTYDGMNRLTKMNRGTLSGGTITDSSATFTQSWGAVESLGNWRSVTEDTNGGGAGGGTTQTRTHNKANEIADLSNWPDPAHDPAGNTTSGPSAVPGQQASRHHYVYDAWNRLAAVKADASGSMGSTIVSYEYDGTGRRIQRTEAATSTTTSYYFDRAGRALEEREKVGSGSEAVKARYVWGLSDASELVLRDRDADDNAANGLEQRLYPTRDAAGKTTAWVNASGTVVQRQLFDAFGRPQFWDGTWTCTGEYVGSTYLGPNDWYDPATGIYHTFREQGLAGPPAAPSPGSPHGGGDYHPGLGRPVQRDPGKAGGNPYDGGPDGPNGDPGGDADPFYGGPHPLPPIDEEGEEGEDEFDEEDTSYSCGGRTPSRQTRRGPAFGDPKIIDDLLRTADRLELAEKMRKLEDLLKRMTDDSWKEREKAQKEYADAVWNDATLEDLALEMAEKMPGNAEIYDQVERFTPVRQWIRRMAAEAEALRREIELLKNPNLLTLDPEWETARKLREAMERLHKLEFLTDCMNDTLKDRGGREPLPERPGLVEPDPPAPNPPGLPPIPPRGGPIPIT